jgi:hypothetical protein
MLFSKRMAGITTDQHNSNFNELIQLAISRGAAMRIILGVLSLVCFYVISAVGLAEAASVIKHVVVIAMENTDAVEIYGSKRAPYINNSLIPNYARAGNFIDPLHKDVPSEPHYLFMEAGTRKFADWTFDNNDNPSPANSTGSKDHLVSQIAVSGNVTWMTYQEDMPKGGQCPIVSVFPYAAKHNPFVFFRDISGDPPSKMATNCIEHAKPYSSFAADLAANNIANYVFITPNLCHDMHGDKKCPKVHRVTAGDRWLETELPRIIDWVNKNSGVIFIVWDEGHKTLKIPFLAIGPGVKSNFESSVQYDHGSLVRSAEEIFGLPLLPTIANKNSFVGMFKAGSYP